MPRAKPKEEPIFDAHGVQLCGSNLRGKPGQRCRRRPSANGRCHLHGGKNVGGPASATWKTGRYSKYVPTDLLARYHAGLDDENLLVLRDEIALLDVRRQQLVENLGVGVHQGLWDSLDREADLFLALQSVDPESAGEHLKSIIRLIKTGTDRSKAWAEFEKSAEMRSKLAEKESKRMVAAQQLVTAEQSLAVVARIIVDLKASLGEFVRPDVAQAIMNEVSVSYARHFGLSQIAD